MRVARMHESSQGKNRTDLSAVPLPLHATSFLKKLGAQGFQTSQLMMDSLVVPGPDRSGRAALEAVRSARTLHFLSLA